MEDSKRMSELLLILKMDAQALAKSIGKRTGDTIRNVILERNRISAKIAAAIEKKHGVSYIWLMTGTGEVFNSGSKPNEPSPEIQTSECKVCIANERTIIAQERTIKLLENENEKLKKTIEKRNSLGGSGTISDTTPKTKTGTR